MDKISFTSFVDTYINYETKTTTIRVNGTFANGSGGTFTATIPYTRGKTRADLYARHLTTGIKIPLTVNSRINPFTNVSSEFYNLSATYNGSIITITATITNNSGGTVSTDQTLEISAVLYEVPYTA